jgi:DNA-binding MltR family transcriptional regulator
MWLAFNRVIVDAFAELKNGSDRTIGIVAGAIVDSSLTDILQGVLRRDDSDYSRDIQSKVFQPDGPLGNFGAKIWVAYLLGYLTEIAHDDLQNFKNIRNLFAHYSDHNSFETQRIKDRCANFRLINDRVLPAQVTFAKDGATQLVDSVFASHNGVCLCLVNHEEALKTAKSRFISAAKLFCAGFEIHRTAHSPKPIF